MFKSLSALIACSMYALSCFAGPTTLDCQTSSKLEANLNELETVASKVDDCPTPSKNQFQSICQDIWDKEMYEGEDNFGYAYQETLWKISCAKPDEDLESAKLKIQKMWLKHRENFRCYYHSDSVANEKNIAKFSIDSGFTVFISESVKKYKLDMNFKDPADNKTVLDFINDQVTIISSTPPVNEAKITEYRRLYKMLELSGAKQAKDL